MELLCAKSKKFLPKYIYPLHKHENIEVMYVISGSCLLQIEEERTVLNKGDSLLISANVNHNFIVGNTDNCIINHLELIVNSEYSVQCFDAYVKLSNCEIVNDILDIIHKCNSDQRFVQIRESVIRRQFEQLEEIFIEAKKSEINAADAHLIVKKICTYLHENFLETISLEEIAGKFGYSSRYIRKIFHQYNGISPNNYLIMLRLEYSKALLAEGKLNITEIAIRSGFDTVQYFSKIFKKRIGISPGDFKKINKEGVKTNYEE